MSLIIIMNDDKSIPADTNIWYFTLH